MTIFSSLLLASSKDTIIYEEISLRSNLSIPNISNINHDKDGNLWISTFGGLYRYDGYDIIKYISNNNEKHGLVNDRTCRTHLSTDGTLWIVGEYSIYKYDPSTERIIRMSEAVRENYKDLYEIGYFDIEDIDDRYMALGSKVGLYIYDKELQEMITLDSLVQDYAKDRYSTNAHVLQIERDPENEHLLWLLTRSGLFTFDCLTKTSKLVFYDKRVNFESLNDRGFSLIPTADHIYFLVNFLYIFKYEKSTQKFTEIQQNYKGNVSHHIRNLVPHDDGFMIVYIGYGLHHYSLKENRVIPIDNFIDDSTLSKSTSFVGFDHEGRYTFVSNNKKLVKSKEKIETISYPQKVFTKNLIIEGYATEDNYKDSQIHILESYERNLQFDIGLTNRNNHDKERYYYRKQKDDDWIELDTNRIILEDFSAGNHSIYVKIDSNEESFEALVKQFDVKPYVYETTWFALLLLFGLIGIASIISYLVNLRKKDKKIYQKKMLELEMSALRSQMNPHFLFNSINSIKSYVISKDKEEAADYLTQFAKLIRMILENSRKKYLLLEEEIDMLRLYIIMEQKRLNFSFSFDIDIDPEIDPNFMIAPMLIQPYVENAIWHGLMNKYENKKLTVKIINVENGVLCKVIDNGIGRLASRDLLKQNTTSKKSLGLKITEDRIDIIKNIYKINASSEIIDLYNDDGEAIGTEVRILLPLIEELPPL